MIALGPAHETARATAAATASRTASLSAANAGLMEISLHTTDFGTPGAVQAHWQIPAPAATLDTETGLIVIAGPVLAQIAYTGMPTWARITVAGEIWLDCTVSGLDGDAPLQIDLDAAGQLHQGGYAVFDRAELAA